MGHTPDKDVTGNWIILLGFKATAAETQTVADKIDALGKDQNYKVLDHFPGTLLVKCDEAFARQIEKQLAEDVEQIAPERLLRLPETKMHLKRPKGPKM